MEFLWKISFNVKYFEFSRHFSNILRLYAKNRAFPMDYRPFYSRWDEESRGVLTWLDNWSTAVAGSMMNLYEITWRYDIMGGVILWLYDIGHSFSKYSLAASKLLNSLPVWLKYVDSTNSCNRYEELLITKILWAGWSFKINHRWFIPPAASEYWAPIATRLIWRFWYTASIIKPTPR